MKKLIYLLLIFFINIKSLENQKQLLKEASDEDLTKIVFDYMLKPVDYVKTFSAGNNGFVNSVNYSPNGKYLASSAHDKTIKIWDIATGQCIKIFSGHNRSVNSVNYSPDGRYLASISYDATIKIWDIAIGQCIKTFSGHNSICSVNYSPDGKYLASGTYYKTIKILDIVTGQCIKTFSGHNDWVRSLNYSPDGRYLASGSNDGEIKIWDIATGQCIKTFSRHNTNINSVNYSPDGKYLASGSGDETIRIWDIATGQCIKFSGHNTSINSVNYSPDGKYLASGSGDETIKIWDIDTEQCIKTFSGHNDWVYSVDYSPDGKYLASGSGDKTIKIWDIEKAKNNEKLFLLLNKKRLKVFENLKKLINDNFEYFVSNVNKEKWGLFLNTIDSKEKKEFLYNLRKKVKPTFATYIKNSNLSLLMDDTLNINQTLFETGQTKKHLTANLKQALGIRDKYDTFNKPEVQKYFLEIYSKEKEENRKQNYVFYHGRKKTLRFIEEVYRNLWCIKNNENIKDFIFVRFEDRDKVNKPREDYLFMNYALFGNCHEQTMASTVTQYWLRDRSVYNSNFSVQKMFEKFAFGKLYKKYEKELLELEKLHNNGSEYGDILMLSIPQNKIDFVKIVAPGGDDKAVFINGRKVESTKIVLDALMTNPGLIDREVSNWLEFALPITNEYALDPHEGPKIYSYYFLDENKKKEYEEKRNELFRRIKKDYLDYKKKKQEYNKKNALGKIYTDIRSML